MRLWASICGVQGIGSVRSMYTKNIADRHESEFWAEGEMKRNACRDVTMRERSDGVFRGVGSGKKLNGFVRNRRCGRKRPRDLPGL